MRGGGSGSCLCSRGEFKEHFLLYSEILFPFSIAPGRRCIIVFQAHCANIAITFHATSHPSMSEILSYRPHGPQENQEYG